MRLSTLAFLLLLAASAAADTLLLSLSQAIDLARERNILLVAAAAGVQEARGNQLRARAGYLPSITLTERALRSNDAVSVFGFKLKQERFAATDFAIEPLNEPRAATDFQTTLSLRQPLFSGGGAYFGRRQARAAVAVARSDQTRRRQEVEFHTAQAYWGLVLSHARLRTLREAQKAATAHARDAESRHRQQTIARADLLAARLRLTELEGEEIAAANGIATATDQLSLLTGLDAGVVIIPADSLGTPSSDLEQGTGRAPASRPDLEAMRLRLEAARQGVGIARSARLPQIHALAQIDLDADAPFSRQGESWTVGAAISLNLFSGGRIGGDLQAARARLTQARAQTRFLEEQVVRERRAATRAIAAARAQLRMAADALQLADERLRIVRLRYAEGLVTTSDLLTAETALTRARMQHLEGLHALRLGMEQSALAAGSIPEM